MFNSRGFYTAKEFNYELEKTWLSECEASGEYFIILRTLPYGIELEWSCVTDSQSFILNKKKKSLVDNFLKQFNQKFSEQPSLCQELLKQDTANNKIINLNPGLAEDAAACLRGFFERVLSNSRQLKATHGK